MQTIRKAIDDEVNLDHYAIRSKPVLESLVGIVNTKLPAVTVCAPNVWTLTALLLWVEL